MSLLLPLQQYRLLRPKIKGTGYSLTVLVTIEGGRYPVVVDGVWKGELSKTSVLWVVVSCAELPPSARLPSMNLQPFLVVRCGSAPQACPSHGIARNTPLTVGVPRRCIRLS